MTEQHTPTAPDTESEQADTAVPDTMETSETIEAEADVTTEAEAPDTDLASFVDTGADEGEAVTPAPSTTPAGSGKGLSRIWGAIFLPESGSERSPDWLREA